MEVEAQTVAEAAPVVVPLALEAIGGVALVSSSGSVRGSHHWSHRSSHHSSRASVPRPQYEALQADCERLQQIAEENLKAPALEQIRL